MRKPYRTARPNPRLLEPRMVFDGAAADTAVKLAVDTDSSIALAGSIDDSGSLLIQQQSQPLPLPTVEAPRQIAFVDASLLKDGTLPGLAGGVELVALQPDADGIAQIGAALAGRSDISAIYIVSHGGEGRVTLGSTELDNATLAAHAADIAAWAPHLSSGADILLYGCQVGAGGDGLQLLQSLADLTGADIAASTNNTGPASLGGDWTLEQSTGSIEAQGFASADALAQFDALLTVNVSSNSLTGWTAVTPANNQNDATNDQQTGSGSVSQDVVGDATYRAAYVKYDNGGTASDLSDDWLAFRVRVNNQDSNTPSTPSFKNFAFFGVDADGNGTVDFFAGVYNPANNSGRIGVYDANGAGNTGPSDTGINGTPAFKYDSTTTGYGSLYSVIATGDGSNFSGDTDYFVSFQIKIADLNANKAAFGLTANITQSTVMRYIVGTAAQDNAFNQDISGITGGYMSSTQTWSQLGAFTAPLQTDGSTPLVASADYATAVEKGGTANGTAGTDPTGNLLSNDAGTGITVTKVQTGSTVGASASTVSASSTSTLNATVVNGSYGTLTLGADGSYKYAVNNALGSVQALRTSSDTLTDTFSYRITDSAAGTSDATLTVTLTGADDAPTITSGSTGTVSENAALSTVIYTATGSDVDSGDTKTYSLKSGTGDIALLNINSSTGAVTLKASADYETKSSYTLTVVVTDTAGLTDEKAVTVAVMDVNEAPTAVADTASATEKGGTANATAGADPIGNVLTNDTDPDAGDTKTVTAISVGANAGTVGQSLAGSYGSLTLNADGSYSYAVNNTNATVQALRTSSDTLTETFNYTMRDAAGLTSSSTLTVTIHGANDAPVMTSGSSGTVAENAAVSTVIYTATASDVDSGDTKTYSLKSGTGDIALLNINSSTGAVTLKASADYETKSSYTFTVVVTDTAGLTDEKTVTVAVSNVNEGPTAGADTALATEKGGTANGTAGVDPTGNVLSNDTDPDAGDTKTVSAVSVGGTTGTVGQSLAGSYGILTLNADGSYSYAVNNTNATVQALRTSSDTLTETFSYTMRDAGGLTSSSTLTITISGADDAPAITSGSSGSITENAAISTAIYTAASSDVDSGDTKTYSLKSGTGDVALLNINSTTGVVTLKASADYETKSSYNFTVVVTDAAGLNDEKIVTVAVTDVNEAPVASADTALATEKGGTANGTAGVDPTGNVLSNDTDADAGDTKTVSAVRVGSSGTVGTVGQSLAGSYGSLTLNADGSYSYAVNNTNTTVQALRTSSDTLTETFSYTMRDAGGLTSSSTLTITIRGANDAPAITSGSSGSIAENASTSTPIYTAAASDVDSGDAKTYSLKSGAGDEALLNINSTTGVVTLKTSANYETQSSYAFTVVVTDTAGLTDEKAVTVAVVDVNETPTAVADTASATEKGGTANDTAGTDPTGNLLSNDTDPDGGDTRTVSAISIGSSTGTVGQALAGSYGTLTVHTDGSYAYVVNNANASVQAMRSGSDTLTETFAYTMRDAAGLTSSSTLTVTIHGANDAPVMTSGGSGTVAENAAVSTVIYTATASDVDSGDTKTYSLKSGTGDAALLDINASTGAVTLKASADFETQASYHFTVVVTDAGGLTDEKAVTVAVSNVNEGPTAGADTALATEKGGTANGTAGVDPIGNVLSNDTDPDAGDTKTVSAVSVGGTTGTVGQSLAGSYGSLTLNADGSYSYAVNNTNATVQALRTSSDTLTETFSYTMRDAGGLTSSSTLTITIRGADDAPVAVADGASATESGASGGADPTGNVLANDTDVDSGDGKTVSAVNGSGSDVGNPVAGSYGSLTLNADGSYSYTVDNANAAVDALNAGDTLNDSFSYTVTDTDGLGSTSALTITIHGVNDAPVASTVNATSATVGEAMTPVVVPAFTDVDNTALTYSATQSDGSALPSWLSFDPTTRTFSGTPPIGSAAVLSLRVTGSDGSLSDHANFNLTVADPTAPQAGNDAADATEAGGIANGTVGSDASGHALANDSGSRLTVTRAEAGNTIGSSASGVDAQHGALLSGSHGQLSLQADGSFAYEVANGNAAVQAMNVGDTLTDTFSYEVTDQAGQTSTATITITLHGANDAPHPSALPTTAAVNGQPMAPVTVPVFTDVDNATLTYSATLSDGSALPSWLSFDTATRTFSGTPPSGVTGTLGLCVTGDDGQADAKLHFNLVVVNPGAPVAFDDSGNATEAGPAAGSDASGNLLANDAGTLLGVNAIVAGNQFSGSGTAVNAGSTLASGATQIDGEHGSLFIAADGGYRYELRNAQPAVDALNAGDTLSDTFAYQITDPSGQLATALLTITIDGANDAPVASVAAPATATVGEPMTPFTVPAFTDVDNTALTYTATRADGSALPGWLSFDPATRTFSGTPPIGSAAVWSLRVSGSDGSLSDHTDISLTVANPAAPQAGHDAAGATEAGGIANGTAGSDASGQALANDSGSQLAVTRVAAGSTVGSTALAVGGSGATDIAGQHGTLSLQADGSYGYRIADADPAVQALNVGDTLNDSFSYEVTDQAGQTTTAAITITIRGANDAPVASAVTATPSVVGEAMTPVVVPAFADVDNTHLSYTATQADGSALPSWLTFDPTSRTFSGTPPAGSAATLALRVTGSDGHLSDHVQFNLVVGNPSVPQAGADVADATEAGGIANGTAGSDASGNALGNDSGAHLTVTRVDAGTAPGSGALAVSGANATAVTGSHGTLSLRADGSYSYRIADSDPAVQALNVGDTLTDTFSYEVTDQAGQTSTATITITIRGANDAPVALPVSVPPLTGGQAMPAIQVPAFTDVDNSVLTYTATLADGRPLPAWLNFDPATRSFSGTPPAEGGTLPIRVSGSDGTATASSQFNLVVSATAPAPQTPVVLPPVVTAPVVAPPAPAVVITAPVDVPRIAEPTPIARATVSATPALPIELGRLPAVPEPAAGELFTDSRGFRVVVMPSNLQELSVFRGLSDQFVERGSDVKFNLPQDAFVHARPDQVVRLSARQADGSPLPAWLQFDAANGSFVGTPPKEFKGEVRISVVARDGAGNEAAAMFRLNVEEPRSSDARSETFTTSLRDALPFAPQMPPLPELPGDEPAPDATEMAG